MKHKWGLGFEFYQNEKTTTKTVAELDHSDLLSVCRKCQYPKKILNRFYSDSIRMICKVSGFKVVRPDRAQRGYPGYPD